MWLKILMFIVEVVHPNVEPVKSLNNNLNEINRVVFVCLKRIYLPLDTTFLSLNILKFC